VYKFGVDVAGLEHNHVPTMFARMRVAIVIAVIVIAVIVITVIVITVITVIIVTRGRSIVPLRSDGSFFRSRSATDGQGQAETQERHCGTGQGRTVHCRTLAERLKV